MYVLQWDISAASVCAHAPCSPAASASSESSPALSVAARSLCHLPFCARTPPRLLRSASPLSMALPLFYGVAFCSVGGLPCHTC